MIVTCPGCTSKYRVRNDAVPSEGARMRCPKCSTLFLAKPPSDPQQGLLDDPSSMYAQLSPSTTSPGGLPRPAPGSLGDTPRPPAPAPVLPPQPSPSSGPKLAAGQGPITALFQAFDPGKLPADAQRPPQPPKPPPGASFGGADGASGLELGPTAAWAPPQQVAQKPLARPGVPSSSPRVPAKVEDDDEPSRIAAAGSWASIAVAGALAVFGAAMFAWSTETANLDAALMPMFEKSFGRQPPRSSVGKGEPVVDELRRAAQQAADQGDMPRSVVLWKRVKAREPADPRASAAIAKMLSDLGDIEGAS